MARATTALFLTLVLAWGCATAPPVVPPAITASAEHPDTLVPDPSLIVFYREGVDSAAALFDFGDIADFVIARDSLRRSLDALVERYPSAASHPDFEQILKSLDELDSLVTSNGFEHRYLNEIDSLALSIETWPDIDSTQSQASIVEIDDSPFPIVDNERIDFWIRYYTGPGKDRFERSLYRMQLHRPTVEPILRELGLPNGLICVALIESGFNLKARSRARAVGPWQFIAGTARIYGLRVSWWYDERRDIVASTYAAGNYLKDLYGLWNDWLLALAAYNCGEYRVVRAIARQKTSNFWALRLPKQTQRYVPKFLATLYLLRDPAKYGLTIPEVEPVKFDQVTIKDATDLKVIAKAAEASVDYLRKLNPSLLRWCTPPKTEIAVKVPIGTGDRCTKNLAAIPPEERVTWRRHRIRQGETLSQIARRFNTTVTTLKRLNGIRNAHRIRAGKSLIVPVQGSYVEVASSTPRYRDKRRNLDKAAMEKYAKRYEPPANHKRVMYHVKDRDTLGEIAEVFHTSAKKLRWWNNLSYGSYIYPGQKLTIYVPESFDVSGIHLGTPKKPNAKDYIRHKYTVRKGDSFYSISRKFDVKLTDLLVWNDKSRRSTIYPGQVLEIWQKKKK
ncbi:MAG: LysM peptidoglycan-binding domain-containing protein [Candidatus Latescibacterota bacterium]|nr:MAG: LysM peptidoglycan-binding domain-containing protein [Candidatus Latescibacterota bacterium]